MTEMAQMLVCQPGSNPQPIDGSQPQGVIWCDLEADLGPEGAMGIAGDRCTGVELDMARELTTPDELPLSGGRTYDDGRIRLVSIAGIEAQSKYPAEESEAMIGSILVQPVELLASKNWLLSCWHRQRRFSPDGSKASMEPPDAAMRDRVLRAVGRAWAIRSEKAECGSGGDLGLLLMHELALTFAPTQRRLHDWLEDWELRLYQGEMSLEEIGRQREALRELWRLRAVMRDWISPLNRPGMSRDEEKIWLPASGHSEAQQIDDRIDRTLQKLTDLGETLRASFHLLHAEEQEGERERREEFQRRVEVAAAIFLIPTFVVGFYGSNTWLPGEGQRWGFAVMVAVVIALTVVGVTALRWVQRRRSD